MGLCIVGLQLLNGYDATGYLPGRNRDTERGLIGVIDMRRELARLDELEGLICRMAVEGYTVTEIGRAAGYSRRTIGRVLGQVRWSLEA